MQQEANRAKKSKSIKTHAKKKKKISFKATYKAGKQNCM